MVEKSRKKEQNLWYLLLALGVVVLSLAGYIGYELYPRFNLPAVSGLGLFVLAAAAGAASFFSPCSFPLLVTLLSRAVGAEERTSGATLGRTLQFGLALSVGASAFLLLAGALIAAGGAPLFAAVTFTSSAGRIIRTVVGLLLILLGLIQAEIVSVPLPPVAKAARPLMRAQAQLRRERPLLGFSLFGFGYLLAGFGWTGPILAGLAGHSFTQGGAAVAFFAFVVAALAIVLLMFGLAAAIGTAQERVVNALQANTTQVKKWGGRILILVGLWLIALSIWADFFAQFFPV